MTHFINTFNPIQVCTPTIQNKIINYLANNTLSLAPSFIETPVMIPYNAKL